MLPSNSCGYAERAITCLRDCKDANICEYHPPIGNHNEYRGAWMTTYTGKKFHFLDPKPEEIDIRDIAHHLSLLCRFTGACSSFYSVADHSIRVANNLPCGLQMSGLLHDAAEAYLNDISRPVKHSHKLEETEKHILDVIAKKYDIDPYHPLVREIDNILLATEKRDLMTPCDNWEQLPTPLKERIVPATNPGWVESNFLVCFLAFGGNYD